jgi:hypothetical protein
MNPPPAPEVIPGGQIGLDVVEGGRMTSLPPDYPASRFLKTPVDRALRETVLTPVAPEGGR